MSQTRRWSLGALAVALLVLVAGWFLVVSPKRGEAAELRDRTRQQVAQNDMLTSKIRQLQAQQAELPAQQAALARIHRQLPATPQVPQLLRALSAAARSAGVRLTAMTPSEPAPLTPAVGGGTSSGTAAGAAPSTAAGATGSAAGATGSAAGPAASLVAVPISLETTGSFYKTEMFINRLEKLPRAFLVTGLTVGPQDGAAKTSSRANILKLSLTGKVFVVPTSGQGSASSGASPRPSTP